MGLSRRARVDRLPAPITLTEVERRPEEARDSGASELRFRFGPNDPQHLEALREARRAMLREEWTRGLLGEEPGLAEATFTASQISWRVAAGQEDPCRHKLATLIRRANAQIVQIAQRARSARPPRRGPWDQGPIHTGLYAV
jgi:hypothetical protein